MTDVTADPGAADAVAADAPVSTARKPKAAPKPDAPALPDGCVMVRVLPMGDGKVFTGSEVVNSLENRFPTYKRGDQFALQADIAQAQELAGRVEIL